MNKYTLITGTTSGIGKALAKKFASEGHNLFLVARNEELLKRQANYFRNNYKIKVHTFAINLTNKNAASEIYEAANNFGIRVDYLVNNAGFGKHGRFLNTNLRNEINMIRLHTIFITKITKLFMSSMVKNGYGRILNIASTAALTPTPNMAVYSATKAYIYSFSRAINYELKGTGVTVTVLCPGATHTAFARKTKMKATLLYNIFVLDANRVANIGYNAMMAGKPCVIVGVYNKMLILTSKLLPTSVSSYLANILTK